MKKLERSEMKGLKGGVNAPPQGFTMTQSGWNLQGSNCYCDYRYVYVNGSVLNYCQVPCATICCTAGSNCGLAVA